MTDMKYDYPEGLTTCDHLAHDIKQGRFPERSSISQFICERAAPEDKVAPETAAKIAALANRFWRIHPSNLDDLGLTREEFYASQMTKLLASETARLTELNNKLTEDFNTLALDRSQWQERAEKASLSLAAEQAINKDLKAELDEARADIEASISDFKVAGGKLSEAQDELSKLRAMLKTAHGKFCKIAGGEAWTDTCLDGYRKTPGGLREFAENAAKEIDQPVISQNDGLEECGNWSATDPIAGEQRSAPRWQDIKTAPKNGTKIIGGAEDDETVFVCAWDAHDGFNDGDWIQYGSDVVRPTKWIPMPANGENNANDK